jgi:hypothetical protein
MYFIQVYKELLLLFSFPGKEEDCEVFNYVFY